ncbi:PLDc N-terminal domain-containing protein [Clavibacter sp. MX14-G9D]|uniref:PLDc N-terminal domain-containing protein n=1 Tax=Clavibacter sp. MX14-G9D TaxID=3064656 RepID=UPI00293E5CA7|nr:PLDc N-terminal domain-containing protein [Clavibacter sp. MX14-G9D]
MVLLGLLPLLVAACALVDLVTRPDDRVKHLPKLVWILLIVLLPLVGSIVWFCVGHDWDARLEQVGPPDRSAAYERAAVAVDRRVRSTEQQLADLEEEERRHAELGRMRQLRAEQAVQAARAAGPARERRALGPGGTPEA